MTNGRVQFEIDKVKRSLYFGMIATQIFTEKAAKVAVKEVETNDVKTFAYLVYAGLCNQMDLLDMPYPTFEQAYELTEKILQQGDELQTTIYKTWEESKPAKDMMAKLPKAAEEVESTPTGKKKGAKIKQPTGTK